MLPMFPNARKAMSETFSHELFDAHWNVSPLLKQLRVRSQMEGKHASYERCDGKIKEVDYEAHRVVRKMEFADAQGLDPQAFLETARDIGTEMGAMLLNSLFTAVNQAVEEVGNVTK